MHCCTHGFRLLNLTIVLVLTGKKSHELIKSTTGKTLKNIFAIFTGAFCESSETNDGDGSGSGDDDYDDKGYNSGYDALNFSSSLLGVKDSLEYEVRNYDSLETGVKSRAFQIPPPPHVPGPVQAKRIKQTQNRILAELMNRFFY